MGRIPPEGCDAESDHGRSHDGSGSGFPREVQRWLDTPLKEHIARWKYEIAEGLRDKDGRWVGGPRRQRRSD